MKNGGSGATWLLVLAVIWLASRARTPDPRPDPPDPDSLVAVIRGIARDTLPRDARNDAPRVAAVYRDISREVSRLRDPLFVSPIRRPQEAVGLANSRIDDALGPRRAAWAQTRDQIAAELSRRQQAGEIGRGIYDVGQVMENLAKALEGI